MRAETFNLVVDAGPSFRPAAAMSAGKRFFDIVFATSALAILSPLLGILWLCIKLTDRGPAMFAHERVGAGGGRFRCLKFRSMVLNGDQVLERHLASNAEARQEWANTQKLRHDPRITRIGRFLRRSSLDELPQLINVLLGQMSIVGPRPIVIHELGRYGKNAGSYLSVRPGLTGLWQVTGRGKGTYAERIRIDRWYVAHWSFVLDCKIILKTVGVVLGQRGS